MRKLKFREIEGLLKDTQTADLYSDMCLGFQILPLTTASHILEEQEETHS